MRFNFRLLRNRKLRIILLLVMIDVVYIQVNLLFEEDIRSCYIDQSEKINANNISLERLEDILRSPRKPRYGRTIFFHETRCYQELSSPFKNFFTTKMNSKLKGIFLNLQARQACAVESAALHNPNFDVFVNFASPAYYKKGSEAPFIKALLSYSNVFLRNLDMWSYAKIKPAMGFLETGALFKSLFVTEHISDFLRLISLWRWGGIYLDLDVISLKSIEKLPFNYAGIESEMYLNSGVLSFSPTGWGHKLVQECLTEFGRSYDKDSWGNNGPILITRVIEKMCDVESIAELRKTDCQGFRAFGQHAFFELNFDETVHLFEPQYTELILKRLNGSYLLHMWNKISASRSYRKEYNAAYSVIAKRNCPKVYALAGDYI